jgi:protein arginine N-methyltransferase 7
MYYAGLKKVIGNLKAQNKPVRVLDIGTGTGLLSMMAVRCGADKVTACEAFKPMAEIAKKCLAANGMKDKVQVVEKRSTDIEIGSDMTERANVLVTEVFDTELIGEGAIQTFNHAIKHLLEPDCYVIPDHAYMYAQVVDSGKCHDFNWLDLSACGIKSPQQYSNIGGNVIHDVQLSQFTEFTELCEPKKIFKYLDTLKNQPKKRIKISFFF